MQQSSGVARGAGRGSCPQAPLEGGAKIPFQGKKMTDFLKKMRKNVEIRREN